MFISPLPYFGILTQIKTFQHPSNVAPIKQRWRPPPCVTRGWRSSAFVTQPGHRYIPSILLVLTPVGNFLPMESANTYLRHTARFSQYFTRVALNFYLNFGPPPHQPQSTIWNFICYRPMRFTPLSNFRKGKIRRLKIRVGGPRFTFHSEDSPYPNPIGFNSKPLANRQVFGTDPYPQTHPPPPAYSEPLRTHLVSRGVRIRRNPARRPMRRKSRPRAQFSKPALTPNLRP